MIVWEPKLLFLAWAATPLVSDLCILMLFRAVLTVLTEAFKAMVAARIGRQPHEIMLKRQGERPFKDHLTLDDYGVSNGVQLDLELDTGD
jgi:hypothetical protein